MTVAPENDQIIGEFLKLGEAASGDGVDEPHS
jgi:hypothetical protein